MATHTQAGRWMRQVSSLGDEDLMLVAFTGEEGVSMPGGFALDLCSPKGTLAAKDFLRKPMGVVIEDDAGNKRYLQGLVRRFSMVGEDDELTYYRAEVAPWLWFLTLSSDCKIFQNQTVLQILEEVFKGVGFTDFENRCLKTYPKREYCVQWRESHFNFVSRLMEDEGIFYFIEHGPKKHVLVLADNPSKIVACPGVAKATMHDDASVGSSAHPLSTMQEDESVSTGVVTYNDFNFLQPKANLLRSVSGKSKEELYEYPGGYEDTDGGDRYAGLTLEEYEAAHRVAFGTGDCTSFTAGHKFALSEHPRKEMNTDWTLLRVMHSGHNVPYRAAGGTGGDDSYNNSFVAIPHSVTYRPPAVTPRPRMRGTQTATVVGKAGEEIWTDKYGRVKVQFHWDRHGKKDENSSCWVRVSTPWAGKNWGFVAIPRINQEVVVDFLEGDPDQPIITGMVYNADFMPPYDLPANQSQLGLKTRSTKGGGAANFNELRFEDKKGEEEIMLHAEKQFTTMVEADEFHTVGANRTTTIQKDDKRINKEGDETVTLEKGTQFTTIKQNYKLLVEEGFHGTIVQKGDTTFVAEKGEYNIAVREGPSQYDVEKGDLNVVVREGDQSNFTHKGKLLYQIGEGDYETLVKQGDIKVNAKLGSIKIEAMKEIELKVGQNTVTISNKGIEIKGMTVKAEGQAQTEIKGAMCKVEGSAMLQAKGGITMIG